MKRETVFKGWIAWVVVLAVAWATPVGATCSTTSNIGLKPPNLLGATNVTATFENYGTATESAWVTVEFDTETHGIDELAFQIVDLPAGWTDTITIEFYEPFTILSVTICPDDPALGDAPDPIDVGTPSREDENGNPKP